MVSRDLRKPYAASAMIAKSPKASLSFIKNTSAKRVMKGVIVCLIGSWAHGARDSSLVSGAQMGVVPMSNLGAFEMGGFETG